MGITKIAMIVKRKKKGKDVYCVISHKKGKDGKHRNFGCYTSKDKAKKRLGQIYFFKGKKASILDNMTSISEELENKGMIHVADAINNCVEHFISESKEECLVGLGKVASLLESKGESVISERIDFLVPEILEFEDFGEKVEKPKTRKMVSADRVYLMASKLYDKYIVGLIDDRDFEYEKMKELVSTLKTGFLLPPPKNYKELPKDADNWWEHFCKRGK